MSSRNIYLDPQEKKQASILYRALAQAKAKILKGERNISSIMGTMRILIKSRGINRIDYIDCLEADSLRPLSSIRGSILIALAVWVGKARLIDNIVVRVK